jgi:phage I-like protein
METQDSLFLSLNFEGGNIPQRIEIIPAGAAIIGRDGRTWKNTNPGKAALNSMARLSMLPIDENHATDLAAPKGGSSPAMGWMRNLCADERGAIWADVEWTERGREALSRKEYRFISPVFLSDKNGEINCVLRAALTNSPNLQLPALNGEQSSLEMPENISTEDISMKKELCAALGLPETAGDAEIVAAVSAQKAKLNSAQDKVAMFAQQVDLAVYAPRTDLNAMAGRAEAAETQLAELNAAQLKKDAEAAVDEAIKNRKIAPASKEVYLNLCATQDGFDKFKKIVQASPAIIGTEAQAPEGTPPSGTVSLNAEEAAVAKAMGYTVEEFQKIKEAGK